MSTIYIVGMKLEEVKDCIVKSPVRDAHDPFAFFGFDHPRTNGFAYRYAADALITAASKDGAEAAYYAEALRQRLIEAGAPAEITITANPPDTL